MQDHDRAKSQPHKKEIGKLLSEIWRIKGLSEQEYGSNHPITKAKQYARGCPSIVAGEW